MQMEGLCTQIPHKLFKCSFFVCLHIHLFVCFLYCSKKQTLTSASKRKASTDSHGAPPSKVSSSTLLDASNADSSSGAQLIKNNRHKHEVCIPVTTLKSKRHNLPKKSKKTVELFQAQPPAERGLCPEQRQRQRERALAGL